MKPELFNEPAEAVSLTSPHFDDERTLLSARAVVPLAKVESKSRMKRGLTLLGTAVLGGTITAVIFLQFGRIRPDSRADTQNSADTTRSDSTSAVASSKDETSAALTKPTDTSSPREAQSSPGNSAAESKPQRKKKSEIADSTDNRRTVDEDNTPIDLWTQRDWRRETRRAERRAEREENRSRNERRDDLFRIRDIFEGSRRP